ncbi:MAG: aspartate aminotransferase family protein [Burkholderiales bacterium]
MTTVFEMRTRLAASTAVDTKAIQKKDAAHYLHPFTDFKALAAKGSRVMVRGEGIYVWDSDGNKLIDGMSGLWNVNLGYGRKELADAAYQQLNTLPFYNSFFQTTNIPATELAAAIADIAPAHMNRVMFANSGSEANDTIVRMVRRYWELQDQPARTIIIGRNNGYHGSTMAGASLGGMAGMHAQGSLPIPDIVHIEQPYYYELGGKLSPEKFGVKAARWLEEKILALGSDRVAAFIGEPVQGAGGVIIPPPTYWPEIQRICDKYGVLLISDEVICGFGRLGRWFGCEYFGTRPDFITFAKAVTSGYIPLGGTIVSDRVADVLIEKGGEFNHGYTYSGHPVACAVGLENIRIFQRENIIQKVAEETAPYLAQRFLSLAHHALVGHAETLGMMAGLVLAKDKTSKLSFDPDAAVGMICRGHCFREGVIMRAVGDRMIIAPPLIISKPEIDAMIALIRRCLDLTLSDVKRLGLLA